MPPDCELMQRIVNRDERAFDLLFDRHRDALYGRLLRIVRSESRADDLLQEVFLRLWTRADQWAGRGAVRAWLMQIATNLALNDLRADRRRRTQPLETPPAPGEGDEEGLVPAWMADASVVQPGDAAASAEHGELLAALIASLPAEKQEVLRLTYEEDMNVREAAEELGIAVGTVKSRLHYARAELAQQWKALQDRLGDI
jgi:RNA polymerase sigma-70 factor (ECF subfamily)